jgi:hypothetical protein
MAEKRKEEWSRRHTIGESLAEGEDIRDHVVVLESEPIVICQKKGKKKEIIKSTYHLPVLPMPVWISSKIKRMLCSSQSLRRPLRNAAGAGTYPPSPNTGSMRISLKSKKKKKKKTSCDRK